MIAIPSLWHAYCLIANKFGNKETAYLKMAMTITIRTKDGQDSYHSMDEIPEGTMKGFVAWMLFTGSSSFCCEETLIEIIDD